MVVIAKESVTNKPAAGSNGSFQSILKARIEDSIKSSVVIKNKHGTAALTFRIMVSNDPQGASGSFDALEISDTEGATTTQSLAAGATQSLAIDSTWCYIDIQIESEDENSPQADAWLLAVA